MLPTARCSHFSLVFSGKLGFVLHYKYNGEPTPFATRRNAGVSLEVVLIRMTQEKLGDKSFRESRRKATS